MMERSRRFILFLVAAILAMTLLLNGHAPPSDLGGTVALSSYTASRVLVRLKGKVRYPGIYSVSAGSKTVDVIKLTTLGSIAGIRDKALLARELMSGDIIEVTGNDAHSPAISLKNMKASERMLLGIPLLPDQMDAEDWDSLPGVGPTLAKNIVEDRQNNGVFCSLEAVQRVPGMGEKKIKSIKKYFN
jgi:competence protein ComEA